MHAAGKTFKIKVNLMYLCDFLSRTYLLAMLLAEWKKLLCALSPQETTVSCRQLSEASIKETSQLQDRKQTCATPPVVGGEGPVGCINKGGFS